MIRDTHEFAKVIAVHPEAHAVDLLFLATGKQISMVQVASSACGTNFGESGLAVPDVYGGDGTDSDGDTSSTSNDNSYSPQQTKTRDVYAIVGYVNGTPFVSGFLFPQVNQMLFKDQNRRVVRHASDVYTNTDGLGNHEFYHPSGTYFRIGTDPAHEDLSGKDFDQNWAIKNNTSAAVHAHLEVWNSGTQQASVDIDPSGNITIINQGNVAVTSQGNVTVINQGTLSWTTQGTVEFNATGAATYKSAASVTIDAPATTITGTLEVKGTTKLDANTTVTGTLTASTDVVANGKSLIGHEHNVVNVQGGSATIVSGPPN